MTDHSTDDLTAAFDGIDDLPDTVDRAAVERMRFVATAMDDAVEVPGTNFKVGIDPILGLIPGGGDLAAGAISLYIVAESARLGVSLTTLIHMLGNIALDVGVGSVPYVGDAFDAVWKANKRNVKLAVRDLADAGADAAGAAAEATGGSAGADSDDGPVEIEID